MEVNRYGKTNGFLDYERETSIEITPQERIQNFNEFHIPLSLDEQKRRQPDAWIAACRFVRQA